MKVVDRNSLCPILLILCAAGSACAQAQTSQEDVKAFVAEYVAAYNAKDEDRLLMLYDSRSRACISEGDKDFYAVVLADMWRSSIPANYKFTVSAVDENNLKAIESIGRFPQKPVRELHIDYQQGEDSGTVIVYLAEENGRWHADVPCATEQTVKQFRDETPERKKLEARYKSLADAIQEPLRSELIKLLREHKRGRAVDRYKVAVGPDEQTAMLVIDQLALEQKQ